MTAVRACSQPSRRGASAASLRAASPVSALATASRTVGSATDSAQ
ncbi:hypothetical protein [Streptomyces sp. NPDC005209]